MPTTRVLQTEILVYDHEADLPAAEQALLQQARLACEGSYSPYSEFQVGAALLLQDGSVVKGANQENASFPAGLCAERTALHWAGANYPGVPVQAIAVVARNQAGWVPISPCGICRQAINEYEERYEQPIRLILAAGEGRVWVVPSAGHLLPLKFDKGTLL